MQSGHRRRAGHRVRRRTLSRCCGHLTYWFTRYEQVAENRAASDRYLLAYRRQYLVVDRYFIELFGLYPDAADWRERVALSRELGYTPRSSPGCRGLTRFSKRAK